MINKKNIWFLTLFSLILVLSVYYITMPNELLLTNLSDKVVDNTKVDIEKTNTIEVLKAEAEDSKRKEIDSLKQILMDSNSTVDKKNEAFDKMKSLDITSSLEEDINSKIKEQFNLDAYTKIDSDNIKVIVSSSKGDVTLANKIMRFVQSNFDTKKYITVEFR